MTPAFYQGPAPFGERVFGSRERAAHSRPDNPKRIATIVLVPTAVPDHYAVLGLGRRCSREEIRIAYRILIREAHPDVAGSIPDATERAQAINAAHEVLSDPAKRRAYDKELAESEPKRAPTPGSGKSERNISQDANLRIEDFLRGTSLKILVKDPANPHGAETYMLDVPPNTAPGTRFRIPREDPFTGGFVIVRVRPLAGYRFKVRGSDLRCDLRISPQRASQGGSEAIPGALGRPVRITIPPNVTRGTILRIPNEGLPKTRGGRGDLLVRVTYRPEVQITRR